MTKFGSQTSTLKLIGMEKLSLIRIFLESMITITATMKNLTLKFQKMLLQVTILLLSQLMARIIMNDMEQFFVSMPNLASEI